MAGARRAPSALDRRADDYEKLDKIAAAISSKNSISTKSVIQPYTIEESAKDVLLDHVLEIVCATIEGAQTLAKHRGAKSISLNDVQLIFAKKHGLDAASGKAGSVYIHQNTCTSTLAGGLEVTSKTKGLKRKFKQDDNEP